MSPVRCRVGSSENKAIDQVHGGYGSPQDSAWREYLEALRAEMLEDMVSAADGERDTVAHQIMLIDQVLRDTRPQQHD